MQRSEYWGGFSNPHARPDRYTLPAEDMIGNQVLPSVRIKRASVHIKSKAGFAALRR
jgi:hypothetical protein